jgi:chromate transporter
LGINIIEMNKPSFWEATRFWIKLGFISFGGPAGHIAIMHTYLVEKKRWISNGRFFHALNYCMLLPGPEATQLATYMGWLLHGRKGGLMAGIMFILPSMVTLWVLSAIYVIWGSVPWLHAVFDGLKPAVIAIIFVALIRMGQKSLHHVFHYLVALAAFIGIFFFHIPFPLIILSALLIAFPARNLFPALFIERKKNGPSSYKTVGPFVIGDDTKLSHINFSWKKLLQVCFVFVLVWVLPLMLFRVTSLDFPFWKTLCIFFTKAAFFTFGGAYAVLPYVAQVSVEQLGWLSASQMLDGLALGETTPGPLIMVLAFVGFIAGFQHFGDSIPMGTIALLTTTYYTFLPCFLFIFAGAPFIEQTQQNLKIKNYLSVVTAAVTGVILSLTIYLFNEVILNGNLRLVQLNGFHLFWLIISCVLLIKYKINLIVYLGISAMYGIVQFYFFH